MGALGLGLLRPNLEWTEILALVIIGSILFSSAIGLLLWRLLLRPVLGLRVRAQDMVSDPTLPPQPLDHYGTSELRDLGESVLKMAIGLQRRADALRAYSDHVTHELKSPLTGILGAAELLQDTDIKIENRLKLVEDIASSARRLARLLDDMRSLGHAQNMTSGGQVTDLRNLDIFKADDVQIQGQPRLELDAKIAELVFDHLIGNARKSGATEIIIQSEGEDVLISDNGSGISPGNSDRIFEPFFTTDRAEGGTGMGLAIVKTVLEASGNAVVLCQKKGRTTFRIGRSPKTVA